MNALVQIGDTYGFLKILKQSKTHVFPSGQTTKKYLCLCLHNDCGTKVEVFSTALRSGHTTSCGCFRVLAVSKKFKTHGYSKHPLSKVLAEMKYRCYNENCKQYKDYGGRGIAICDEWLEKGGIVNFVAWNDSLPKSKQYRKGLEIDRENNDGDYEPDNCRWVTSEVNNNNRSNNVIVIHKNKQIPFSVFWKTYGTGVKYATALWRIKQGWNPIEAVTKTAQ